MPNALRMCCWNLFELPLAISQLFGGKSLSKLIVCLLRAKNEHGTELE